MRVRRRNEPFVIARKASGLRFERRSRHQWGVNQVLMKTFLFTLQKCSSYVRPGVAPHSTVSSTANVSIQYLHVNLSLFVFWFRTLFIFI